MERRGNKEIEVKKKKIQEENEITKRKIGFYNLDDIKHMLKNQKNGTFGTVHF